jgi:Spy/CpxP family protein refolding chaperone
MFSRLLSIAVLSLAAAVAGAAEKPAGPHAGPNRAERLEKMSILLDLDAGQKVQVGQALDEQQQQLRTQMQALREQARSSGQRPDFEQVQQQRVQAEKELLDKLRPVLTDVQLKKFEVLRELTGPRHGPPGRPHRGGQRRGGPDRAAADRQ